MDKASNPQRVPKRKCDVCGSEMKHLGNLPAIGGKPAERVFRCYGCNGVASEPI